MIVAFVVLIALFAVFFLQNRNPVMIAFLSWRYDTSVGLAVIAPLIIGLFIGTLIFWSRAQLLRVQLSNAEERTRSAEGKVREFERQREMTVTEEEQ